MGIKLSGYVNVSYIKTEGVDDDDDQDEPGQRKVKPKDYLDQLDATDFFVESGDESERDKDDGTWSCATFFKAYGEGYEIALYVSFVGDECHQWTLKGQGTESGISELEIERHLSAIHEIPEDDEE